MARPRKVVFGETTQYYFVPYDFTIVKGRTKLDITSKEIPWLSLSEEEKEKQWGYMTNHLWFLENEDVIKRKDLEKSFASYLTKLGMNDSQTKTLLSLKDNELPTYVLTASFLLDNGVAYNAARDRTIGYIKGILQKFTKSEEVKKVVPIKKKDDDLAWKQEELLCQLESMEDDAGLALHKKLKSEPVNFLLWLKEQNVDKKVVPHALTEFQQKQLELIEASNKTNEELSFSYSKWTAKQLKTMIAWYEDLITALKSYIETKIIARKPRVKKPVPPEKVVKNLRYLPKSDELNLESVTPTKLVGAKEVWVYNVKYKKLGIYVASELNQQMTVKGSALIGYDPSLSVCKTIRKPEEFLPMFMKTTKAGMKKSFKDIKSKEYLMNGRFSLDVIILKIS